MTITVTHHEKRLRELPCAVSRMTPVTLHHCHGGTMKDAGWHVGAGQRQNPFLQIPLHAEYHVGIFGIDSGVGVLTWEQRFGSQYAALEWTDEQLSYPMSIFELAAGWEQVNRGKVVRLHS